MSLSTVEYLNVAAIVYADFHTSDIGMTLGQLITNNVITEEDLSSPERSAFADPDFPLRDWELVGVKDGGLNGFFAIALKNPTTGEIVFSFRGSQDVADWTLSNPQIATSLFTPAQFSAAEQFVFETLNTAGPVCYNTLSDMYDAVGSSSNISFTGHSLGGGLAQYMTYKTADFNDTDSGAASVTFNAVGIGQALDDLSLLATAPSYNSVDHVNSNDIVGSYGIQLGDTIRHIDDSEVDYSRVDFTILSEMIFVQIKAAEGTLDAVQASKQLSDLKLALNLKDPESYVHTMRVFMGYESVGGNGLSFSSYHGLDNFLMNDPNGDGQVMTATVTSQSNYLKLGAIFQLINALGVINTAKSEGNYTTNVSTVPPGLQVTPSGGIDYYRPYSHGLENYNYTYSQAAIAYANSIVQNASRNLKASDLAQPYVEYQQAIASNVQRVDPLILDLDGDGIETIHINESNAFFDLDLNGFAENTSWTKGDDGFLVLDRNQDGLINNANELFGDRTLLSDGTTYASSGFHALTEHDENEDGIIDVNDNIYSLLRVWQDLNGDGVSAANELKSLLDLGIVSIALSYLNTGTTDSSDNIQVRVGQFTRDDGSVSAIGEYLFNRDTANSIEEPLVNVPPEIAVLPNMQGAGNVSSLHKAMLDDTSGDLQDLVEAFMVENDVAARNSLMEQIIFKWTGSDTIDPASRGGVFDARKLAVMEKFYGLDFNGNPTTNSVGLLTSSYNKLLENMYVSFIAETHLKDILNLINLDFSGSLTFSDVQTEVDNLLGVNEATGLAMLSELARVVKHYGLGDADGFMTLRNYYSVQSDEYAKVIDFAGTQPLLGTSGDDYLSTSGNQTALDGGEGNDHLYANTTSSVALYGGAGNDSLYGSAGNDILNGGTGNDRLEGSTGNDTYMFGHGFGVDTIVDRDAAKGNVDTVRFLDDVASEDVVVRRNGNNLELSILGTDDKLIVEQYFSRYFYSGYYSYDIGEDGNKVERIIFADGTTWTIADVKEKARSIVGAAGDDSINGYDDQDDIVEAHEGNDYIYTGAGNDAVDAGAGDDTIDTGSGDDTIIAGEGNDTVHAGIGNDTLDGGSGNDRLMGDVGNDTYVFGRGYGTDVIADRDATEGNLDIIQFNADVLPTDVTILRSGSDLLITISGTSDSLRVEQYFSRYYYSGYYSYDIGEDGNKVEELHFADGTIWSIADVKEKARTTVGTGGDDSISGFDDQDDIIEARDGNDYIYTGAGNDAVDAGAGDDTIDTASGDDTVVAGAGNDTVNAGSGNDVIDGGMGNDRLLGDIGNDTYIFGRGYGADVIADRDATEENLDIVQFKADIIPTDVTVSRSGNDLLVTVNGTDDSLRIEQYFSRYYYSGYYSYDVGEDGNKVEEFHFADGTIWTIADMKEKARVITGSSTDDSLSGYGDQANIIYGLDGNDHLYGASLADSISGGAGNDSLEGYDGNDTLDGGTGDDILVGGSGDDVYVFGRGYGADIIRDRDATEGNLDKITMLEDVDPDDITVVRSDSNLILKINDTNDTLTVEQYFSRYYYSGYYSYDIGEDGNKVEQIVFSDGTVWTIADVKEKARDVVGTASDDSLSGYDDQDDRVVALDGNDYISTGAGNDVIDAGAGDDTVYAGSGNDTLTGGAGNDLLYASEGNDTLDGGAGNDQLWGEAGNDTYIFGRGYGVDTIIDRDATEGNQDVIQFAADIAPTDVIVRRNGNNLELQINGTDDKLIIEQYFSRYYYSGYYSYDVGEDGNKVESIQFNDGTTWSIADVKEMARTIIGTSDGDSISGYGDQANIISGLEGNDYLYGASLADSLSGGDGNDELYGYSGNDILDGGAGNDILGGADGDDTYVFGRGYGTDIIRDHDATEGNVDTITMLEGVDPDDITVVRSGDSLVLKINDTNDTLTVEQYFSRYYYSGYYSYDVGEDGNKVERIVFDDGTIWSIADVKEKARYINGTENGNSLNGFGDQQNIISGLDGDDVIYAGSLGDQLSGDAGNDQLYGSYGADTLTGGTGNDQLEGSAGNDTYIFGLGDGVDTIYDSDATEDNFDVISLQDGIDPENVAVRRNGDNLELQISSIDMIIVERYFSRYTKGYYSYDVGEDGNKIEQIQFADGTIWSIADVKEKARYINGTSGDDSISGFWDQQNIISAGEGNDTVYAGGLGDQVDGGAGNDSLFGSSGNNTLTGGTGNDILEGSAGNDIYIFAPGFGNDTVYDIDATEGNVDTIRFLEGIDPANVVATRNGDDLVLTISGTSDTLTVDQYFSQYTRNGYNAGGSDAQKVEVIEFANGTTWSIADIKDKVRHITGTENNDTIYGYSDQQNIITAGAGDDIVYAGGANGDELRGEAGNDSLYGSYGNETLDGGAGNDILEGSSGNDTYLFGLGYGTDTIYDNDTTEGNQDTIQFLAGVAPEDVAVKRSGDNLELSITNTTDKLIVQNYFSGYYRNSGYYAGENANKIETITFANSTTWDIATVLDKARYITGTEDNETISAFDTNDVITALAGDDTVYAGYGNDTIHGNDGNDVLYGDSGNDQLFGDAGNDTLYGADGNDTLDGGIGNDLLEGSYGNDTYVFGIGYGVDTIYDNDTTQDNLDIVNFLPGIAPTDVNVRRNGDNLELRIAGTEDVLIVERYFSPYARNSWYTYDINMNKIEEFHFDDGTIWSTATIQDKARFIEGTNGDDSIYGYGDQQNIINAGDGNDTVYASYLGDELYGEAGNDLLYGSSGVDVLDGGAGNDTLEGSTGNDTYVFAPGFGADTIYDNDTTQDNSDVISFQAGIAPEDVEAVRNGDNLELRITGTSDVLTVERYFSPYARGSYYTYDTNQNKIEQITFSNGVVWDVATILEKVRVVNGTENADTIYVYSDQQNIITAGAGDDIVYAGSMGDQINAGEGNDSVYGSEGADHITGGTGNDTLEGGNGNDTYVFAPGFGTDTIYDNDSGQGNSLDVVEFAAGIASEDVVVRRLSNDDLELTILGTSDKLTIQRFFNSYYRNSSWNTGNNSNAIEEFRFADGTTWSISDIKDKARFIKGSAGDDTIGGFGDQQNIITAGDGNDTIYAGSSLNDELYGETGNDTLIGAWSNEKFDGGTGNDYMEGSAGDDTYVFALGYGQDVIYDSDQGQGAGLDKVTFLEGIDPADASVKRLPNSDLEITLAGTTDKLTIERYFSPYYKNSSWNAGTDSNVVEEFHFSNGTIWTAATIKDKARTMHGTENSDTLQGFGDQQNLLHAGAGDDTIYAGGMNGDELYGEAGNDTLVGSWANETLDGGADNDYLEGSAGNDMYVFGLGYGQDVIYDSNQGQSGGTDKVVFLSGISPADVTAKRLSNSDLELTFAGSSDKLTIERYFSPYYKNSSWNAGTDSNVVEEFHFADDTVWDIDDIKTMVRTINGTENNDVLYGYEDADTISAGGGDDTVYAGYANDVISGGAGNDVLYGEDGNDQLDGSTGNDTLDGGYGDELYVFSGAFGNDQINDYHGNDLVQFSDLNKDNIMFEQVGNALQITSAGASDSVSIGYWYSYNDYKVETIKASDGSTISSTQVEQLIQAMASWSNDNNGMSWSQALSNNQQDVQAIVSQYWTAPTV